MDAKITLPIVSALFLILAGLALAMAAVNLLPARALARTREMAAYEPISNSDREASTPYIAAHEVADFVHCECSCGSASIKRERLSDQDARSQFSKQYRRSHQRDVGRHEGMALSRSLGQQPLILQ